MKTFMLFILLLVLAGVATVLFQAARMYHAEMTGGGKGELPTAELAAGTTTVTAELATTDTERAQGLSGRAGLAQGRGMLFVFQQNGDWGFWMKDMRFPIDIVFINELGIVMSADASVSPDSYPQVFYPPNPARFVLELPAGFAAAHGIGPGTRLTLPAEVLGQAGLQ